MGQNAGISRFTTFLRALWLSEYELKFKLNLIFMIIGRSGFMLFLRELRELRPSEAQIQIDSVFREYRYKWIHAFLKGISTKLI